MYWFRFYLFTIGCLFSIPTMPAQTSKSAPLDVANATFSPIPDFCSDEMGTVSIDGLEAHSFQRQNMNIGSIPSNGIISFMDKADFDNDGDLDIVAGTTTNRIYVLENQGGGTFNRHEIYNNASNTQIIKAIDLDGDNDIDIINESNGGNTIVFENRGNFNFNFLRIGSTSQPIWRDIDIMDYDMDGDMDVFATNNDIRRFTNPGNLSSNFSGVNLNLPEPNLKNIEFMDIDQDNDMDILAYQFDNGQANLLTLINDGTQNYTSNVFFDLNANNLIIYYNIITGDFNNDNYPDFIVGLSRQTGQLNQFLYQFENNQDGTFTPIDLLGTIDVTQNNLAGYQVADLDNEGHLDIIVALQGRDHFELLYNDGTGRFNQRQTSDIAMNGAYDFVIGQFQGNKNMDIIASEIFQPNGLHIYENKTLITNPLVLDYSLGADLNSFIENVKVDGTGKATGQIQLSPGEKNIQFTRLTDSDNNVGSVNFTDDVYVNHAAVEIDLSGNSISIADGDNTPSTMDGTDFGNIEVNTTATQTFSINNQGTAALKLRDNALVTVSDPNFNVSISNISTINPNNTLNFQVAYQPTVAGTHTAEVAILNNDCDETIYNFTVMGTSSQPLPITLSYFSAKATPTHQILLNWSTELEQNAQGFQVEWSTNGKHWRDLAFITAKNQAGTYQHIHQNPNGGDNFYRLRLIDLDHSFKYSPIQVVWVDKGILPTDGLFFPNPTNGMVNIALPPSFNKNRPVQLKIYALTGQILQELEVTHPSPLAINHLSAGLYFMELQQGTLRIGQRVVVK